MKHKDIVGLDMLTRVNGFGTQNATDIAAAPPTVAAKAQAAFTTVAGVVTSLSKAASDQTGGAGDFHEGVASKSVQRELLMAELRGINKSASAIAAAQNTPQILQKFRLTSDHNDTALVANATAFADAATPLEASFIELGHDTNFVQHLRDDITAFNSAADDKNLGAQARSGATASAGPLVYQGLTAVKQLDAIMHNLYKGNAEKMGEWATASHIERSRGHKTQPPAGATAKA
jgi:hypothetical protein